MRKSRVGMFSTSIASVSHAYADHAHQMSANTSAARPNPAADVSSMTSVVTCVNAKTKTRSKKSSMNSVLLLLRLRDRADGALLGARHRGSKR
jgi:hypothetical protein